jgi:hypothetical protein
MLLRRCVAYLHTPQIYRTCRGVKVGIHGLLNWTAENLYNTSFIAISLLMMILITKFEVHNKISKINSKHRANQLLIKKQRTTGNDKQTDNLDAISLSNVEYVYTFLEWRIMCTREKKFTFKLKRWLEGAQDKQLIPVA